MDLTVEGPSDDRSNGLINYDKWITLEKRLRAVEENDLFDPLQAAEVCLVPNIVVLKKFRVPDFIKYTRLKCPNTHLRLYRNKIAEVIHDEKILCIR